MAAAAADDDDHDDDDLRAVLDLKIPDVVVPDLGLAVGRLDGDAEEALDELEEAVEYLRGIVTSRPHHAVAVAPTRS